MAGGEGGVEGEISELGVVITNGLGIFSSAEITTGEENKGFDGVGVIDDILELRRIPLEGFAEDRLKNGGLEIFYGQVAQLEMKVGFGGRRPSITGVGEELSGLNQLTEVDTEFAKVGIEGIDAAQTDG